MEIIHCDPSAWSDLNNECYVLQSYYAPVDRIAFYTFLKRGDIALFDATDIAIFKVKRKPITDTEANLIVQDHLS